VDGGVARAGALGVTGESGGSLQSLELAFLRNRIRLPDGGFAPWRSPAGRRLSITAAYPTWSGDDIAAALQPNGRFLDFARAAEPAAPVGVAKTAFLNALFLVADASGFIAPAGADRSADLRNWKALVDRGEPYGAPTRAVVAELRRYHGSSAIPGTPAPILMQNGWADDLFGSTEALRVYNRLRVRNPRARIALQLFDTGHARGGSHPNQERAANDQALRFFDAWLRRRGTAPAGGSVLAYTQACPRDVSGGTRLVARSWTELHPGAVRMSRAALQRVSSDGGSLEIGQAFTPNFGTTDACRTVPIPAVAPGTAVVQRTVTAAFTLAGRPTVEATLAAQGAEGQLDARLWDVDPALGTQLLVTRGAYRLTAGQRGPWRFQLEGNAYSFAAGHVVKLELVGRDPDQFRPSNGTFSADVSRLAVELPVRERPSPGRGVAKPRFALDPAVP
jgi:X-Pro dipeptidyl-peptidase-like protein